MKKAMLLGCVAALSAVGLAKADPVPLSAFVDQNGYIDVLALTCAQLANTYQQDANVLTAWYSGWYNGLDHKHYLDYTKGRIAEHDVIEYCKAHPDEKIIHAMAIVFHGHAQGIGRRCEMSGGMTVKKTILSIAAGLALSVCAGAGAHAQQTVTFMCLAPAGHVCQFAVRTGGSQVAFALPSGERKEMAGITPHADKYCVCDPGPVTPDYKAPRLDHWCLGSWVDVDAGVNSENDNGNDRFAVEGSSRQAE